MKNFIKRSRFSGYKGMDRIGREAKRNLKEMGHSEQASRHDHTGNTGTGSLVYYVYVQSEGNKPYVVAQFYYDNEKGHKQPTETFRPDVKWVDYYVSTGDKAMDFKIDTRVISDDTIIKNDRGITLATDNTVTDTKTYLKPSTMANAAAVNPLIGDNFFNSNPDKVLGKQTIDHGRFGNEIIKVIGDLSMVEKIDVPPVPVIDLYPHQVFTTKSKQDIIDTVFDNETKKLNEERLQKLRSPNKKTKKEAASANLQGTQEVYSFKEFSDLYNKDISRDEMEAYYFTHPELNYRLLLDEIKMSKEEMLEKGLICWDNDKRHPKYVYRYTYQSGNINKKIAALRQDREKFVAAFSEAQYEKQLKFLQDVRPKEKGLVGDDRLLMLPHSTFAKSIKINELRGKPELNSELSLTDAFKKWLRVQPADMFDKSGYIEIIDYYLDNKVIPIDKNSGKSQQIKDEKNAINIRQRTKEEADKLFGIFLAEELLPEDQSRVAYLWNEKYNATAEPNLSKTPVCLQMSKTFKAGAKLELNATQRQSAAFMQEKKSGLLAYGVGVGKTISSILCMAQAFYNGFCKRPVFVVPTNTYDNWITELQGKMDKQTGVFMQGLMPQLPPVVGLYNLNPVIVKDQLKVYSKDDLKKFEKIEEIINLIRGLKVTKDFTADQIARIQRIYPSLNMKGIAAQYDILMMDKDGKGTGRAKNFPEFVVNYLKDEYNYYIYDLGTIKNFPDGTVFVTTENGLQRLGVSQENKNELESSLYEILSQGEKTASSDDRGKSDRQKEIAKLQLMITQRISSSLKNAKLNIEDLGLDWVCMDEAHYYKKLFTFVKGEIQDVYEDSNGNTKYKRDKTKYELKSGGAPSGRALSAFVLSHYIQMRNDNRNVVLLTATPFTNSPLEVYSMLVLTNYKALQELGLGSMTEFFDTFMKINYDIKYTPQKTVKKDIVLTGYNNLSNLRQVIYSVMDKKDEGANLKRPIKLMYPSLEKGIDTTIPMTAEQDDLIRQVKDYVNDKGDLAAICQESINETIAEIDFDSLDDEALVTEWEKYTGRDFDGDRDILTDSKRESLILQIRNVIKKESAEGVEFDEKELAEEESLGVRILRGISMMKQITLSPYLFHKACSKVQGQKYSLPNYKDFINTSPKLKYTMGCIKSVIDFHTERKEKISGQVIYMANGVEYFPLVKEYLVKELNLKESQVGIVSGGMSKSAKEHVKASFLNGDCLVLIGSQTISVGVNLQNNATVLYNLWFDWNPTDAAQIEGRIWRQGNRFKFVRIVYPMCYNSCDPVIFEYLSSKTLRINEIWNRSSEIQELDLKDFNPKELQKKLITDPEEKAEWEILEETDKVNNDILYYTNRRELLVNALTAFKNFTRLKPMAIKEMNAISAKRAEIKKDQAIKRNSEKLVKITEEFAAEPEKMIAEIKKFNEGKYDHANDPDGRYIPVDHTDMSNLEIAEASQTLQGHLNNVDYRDNEVWGDLYWEKKDISDTLSSLRYNYRDLRTAEERVLKPMGISFDTATNPIKEFDQKLDVLTDRLNAIEDGREEKIERYRKEYIESLKTIKTVEDRIAEFAAANEQLIPPQLMATITEAPVEDIPHEDIKPVDYIQPNESIIDVPVPIDGVYSPKTRFELPEATTIDEVDANVNAILSQYGSRKMANIQVTDYLNEIKKLGKQYVDANGITSIEELRIFLDTKQSKARAGKGKERKAARDSIKQEKTDQDVQNIIDIATEQDAVWDEKIKKNDGDEIDKVINKLRNGKFSQVGLNELNLLNDAFNFVPQTGNFNHLTNKGANNHAEVYKDDIFDRISYLEPQRLTDEENADAVTRIGNNEAIADNKKDMLQQIFTAYISKYGEAPTRFIIAEKGSDGGIYIEQYPFSETGISEYYKTDDVDQAVLILKEVSDKDKQKENPRSVEIAQRDNGKHVGWAAQEKPVEDIVPVEKIIESPAVAVTSKADDLRAFINSQIDGLNVAREFADPDKQAEIDKQLEGLNITLNFI